MSRGWDMLREVRRQVESCRLRHAWEPDSVMVNPDDRLEALIDPAIGGALRFENATSGSLSFWGLPVVTSPLIPRGQIVVGRGLGEVDWHPAEAVVLRELVYVEPPETIKGYVQRQANALRERLGLPIVNYRAENEERLARLRYEYALARTLGFPLNSAAAHFTVAST